MRIKSDQEGIAAMGVVIMLLVVLSLLGTALWQYSMFEINAVRRNKEYLQALYLAHAGAEAAMAFWLNEGYRLGEQGELARVYYTEDGKFETKPSDNYLGFFDVSINKITDPDHEKYGLTEIISTAVVGNTTRSVTLTSYPHPKGHFQHLGWYREQDGQILNTASNEYDEPLVIVEPDRSQPLRFSRNLARENAKFSARVVSFESDIDLAQPSPWTKKRLVENTSIDKNLFIEAETIFFENVTLLRSNSAHDMGSVNYSIVLEVPPSRGIIIDGERYGEVYFNKDLNLAHYEWQQERRWFLFIPYNVVRIVEQSREQSREQLKYGDGQSFKGRAFYFKHGTDLLNLKPGDLIEIPPDKQIGKKAFEELQMFVWE